MKIQVYESDFTQGMPKPAAKPVKGTRRQRIKKRRLAVKNFEKALAAVWNDARKT